jgi:cellulose biosynthesis protein BcsQ
MTALRVTFYSYKGGVGRTLALLNVAAVLAANGRKVVAVDLDLEAPGFGLSSLTHAEKSGTVRGASDLMHDRYHGGHADTTNFCYPATRLLGEIGENLWLMPVGTQSDWLIPLIPQLYTEPQSAADQLFNLLYEEIEHSLQPDFILFDSRTGRADIAGIALLQLAQLVFAMSGLSDQNVTGMEQVLAELREREEPGWPSPVTILGLGPVPRDTDIGDMSLMPHEASDPAFSSGLKSLSPPVDGFNARGWLLRRRVEELKERLLAPIQNHFVGERRQRFPGLRPTDLLHLFRYDPLVPIGSELIVPVARPEEGIRLPYSPDLVEAYYGLADTVARARANDPGLPQRTPSRMRSDGYFRD